MIAALAEFPVWVGDWAELDLLCGGSRRGHFCGFWFDTEHYLKAGIKTNSRFEKSYLTTMGSVSFIYSSKSRGKSTSWSVKLRQLVDGAEPWNLISTKFDFHGV